MPLVGFECVAYRNTGTYGTPVWNEVVNIKDLTLNRDRTEVDVSTRGSGGNKMIILGLRDNGCEFKMVWDPDDADVLAFNDAHEAASTDAAFKIDMLFLDGPVATPGSQGLRATMCVSKFTRGEPLDGAVECDVAVKPTYVDPAQAPTWYTVPGT